MPVLPAITLSALGYTTPDGRALFHDLGVTLGPGRIGLVGANGVGKSTLLHLIAGRLAPTAGHLATSGTVRLLDQGALSDPARSIADVFGVAPALADLARALAGEIIEEVDWTLEARLATALAAVGLADLSPQRLMGTLSGGQRMRVALAALTFGAPDILLLDEPTNDLDAQGRALVADVLARHRGIALVASHDRALLRGMDRILELSPQALRLTGGGWDAHAAVRAAETRRAQGDLAAAERALEAARAEAQRARERKAQRAQTGRKLRASGSQSKLLLDSAKARAEASGSGAARLAHRQREEAEAQLAEARLAAQVGARPVMALAPSGLAGGQAVLRAEGLVLAPAEGCARVISGFDLHLSGAARLALTGPNGAGKSTLLRGLAGEIAPLAGQVTRFVPHGFLDQRVAFLGWEGTILHAFQRLHPRADRNACHRALARFLFRAAEAERCVAELSGGERMRAGLACVLGGPEVPQLLLLDEPNNHLDMASADVLAEALRAYDGALIVASHDDIFMQALALTQSIILPPRC